MFFYSENFSKNTIYFIPSPPHIYIALESPKVLLKCCEVPIRSAGAFISPEGNERLAGTYADVDL